MPSFDHLWDNQKGVCKRCGIQSSESPGPCGPTELTIAREKIARLELALDAALSGSNHDAE